MGLDGGNRIVAFEWTESTRDRFETRNGGRRAALYACSGKDRAWNLEITYCPRIHEGKLFDVYVVWSLRLMPTLIQAFSKAEEILIQEWVLGQ